jgi:hypothetical protein
MKPESKQPPRITDEDKRRDNCQKQVHSNMALNAIGKAFTVIKNYHEHIDCVPPLPEETAKRLFEEKNPQAKPVKAL